MNTKRVLNWRPDKPDFRDFKYKPRGIYGARPSIIDLQSLCTPVFNQGQIGSCTGNALAGAYEFLEKSEREVFIKASRLFIYWNERALEDDTNQDAGAEIRNGIKTLYQKGVCSEKTWLYEPDLLFKVPPRWAYGEAYHHKIAIYERLDNENINDLKDVLYTGFPFVFGFSVYSSFDDIGSNGIMPMPSPNEQVEGGHAVMCVGYNDDIQMFKVRNSWGSEWGHEGYFYMPYKFMTSTDYCDDFWVIKK